MATTPELLKPFCHFPFHCHGKLEMVRKGEIDELPSGSESEGEDEEQ